MIGTIRDCAFREVTTEYGVCRRILVTYKFLNGKSRIFGLTKNLLQHVWLSTSRCTGPVMSWSSLGSVSKLRYFPSGMIMKSSGGVVGVVAPSQVNTIKRNHPFLCITSLHYFISYLTTGPLCQVGDKLLQPLHNSIPLGT